VKTEACSGRWWACWWREEVEVEMEVEEEVEVGVGVEEEEEEDLRGTTTQPLCCETKNSEVIFSSVFGNTRGPPPSAPRETYFDTRPATDFTK
jgi:hypothetical protein